jgi:HlyD family secretion protein
MPVHLAGWGGEGTLPATVRTIEPAAFTKVSALGVEEQRVRVIADLAGPPGPLGDGYRVEARIVTWSTDSALKAPASACFRRAAGPRGASGSAATSGEVQDWAVFTVSDGRARLRPVAPGHRTATEVEVLEGIAAGERVVLHPQNELSDGARVSTR